MSVISLQSSVLYPKASQPSNRSCQALSRHIYSYVGKIVILMRHFLNACARSSYVLVRAGETFPQKVTFITMRLKLFSLAGAIFCLPDLKLAIEKVQRSISFCDKEGIFLDSLTFCVVFGDVLDSSFTFINAARTLLLQKPFPFLATTGLPLACMIASVGSFLRIVQLIKAYRLYVTLCHERRITEILDSAKRRAFLRIAPQAALQALEAHNIAGAKKHIIKKMHVDLLGLAANAAIITALALFTIGSTTCLPFCLLTAGFGIRIASLAYQDFFN